MPKRALSEHWGELRYHMIAGLFWYLASLISLTGITKTFVFLHSHFGIISTVGIDLFILVFGYAAVVFIVRAWTGTKIVSHSSGKFRKVQVHREDSTIADYKWKVRIAITNETKYTTHIRKSFWIANGGEAALELPPKLKMQIEQIKGGWSKNQWVAEEFYELDIPSGFTFRTWIGLHRQLSDSEFGRLQENMQFGTLSLTIDGYDRDVQIPV